MNEAVKNREIKEKIARDYEWGFSSDIEQEFAPKGLDEGTVRFISAILLVMSPVMLATRAPCPGSSAVISSRAATRRSRLDTASR